MNKHNIVADAGLDELLEADKWAKLVLSRLLKRKLLANKFLSECLMSDSESMQTDEKPSVDSKWQKNKNRQILMWIIFFAIVMFFVIRHFGFPILLNVLMALSGIGLIIVSHEFGHFITAKLMDMNVQAFSIGFPPILLGIKRTEKGRRLRILPALFKKEESESADDE